MVRRIILINSVIIMCLLSFLLSAPSLLGVLKDDGSAHDRRLDDAEINSVVLQMERVLVEHGTAIVFCCKQDASRWEAAFEKSKIMVNDALMHVRTS